MSRPLQKNKLWIKGFSPSQSDENVRLFCDQFGKILHLSRPVNVNYVFVTYVSDDEAAQALQKFTIGGYKCHYAYARTGSSASHVSNGQTKASNGGISPQRSTDSPRHIQFSSEKPIATPKPNFRNGDILILTYVENASTFCARQASRDHEYSEFIRQISLLGRTTRPLVDVPKRGMVLALYNGSYYRALINSDVTSNNESRVVVKLADIGLTCKIPVKNLKAMPKEYINTRFMNTFKLKGIEDNTNDSYAAECLKSYIGTKLVLQCDGQTAEPRSSVRLIDPQSQQNINALIKDMTLSYNFEQLIEIPSNPIGKKQMLVTIDESKLKKGYNILTFIEKKDSKQFNKQFDRIQTIGKQLENYPPYAPKQDDLCLVKYDTNWHRGVLIEEQILLIDLRKAVEIDSKDIRNFTTELVQMPVLIFVAAIDGYGALIDKAIVDGIIHNFKANDMICVKSVQKGSEDDIYLIEI